MCVLREREFKELAYKIVKVGKFTICKAVKGRQDPGKLMLHLEFKGILSTEFSGGGQPFLKAFSD